MKLKLETKNKQQELVLEYLESNASDTLIEKINNGVRVTKDNIELVNKKDLDGFFKYATGEARKLVEKGATSACVEDSVVFGWAIHYFEEESIEGTLLNLDGTPYKKPIPKSTYKPPVKVEPPKPTSSQLSMFDALIEQPKEEPKVEQPAIVKEKPKGNSMYQVYMKYQEQYPEAIIAKRLGDFYEVFGDKAVVVGTYLDLTITSRDCGLDERIPMIGFPYHCSEIYFDKISAQYTLAIIENDELTFYQDEDEEDIEELSEEEMRQFDGDMSEVDIDEQDKMLSKLYGLFNNNIVYVGG